MVIVVLYLAITTLGNSTGIGALFTQPFATLLVMSAFEERKDEELPEPEKSEKIEEPQPTPSAPSGAEETPETSKDEPGSSTDIPEKE